MEDCRSAPRGPTARCQHLPFCYDSQNCPRAPDITRDQDPYTHPKNQGFGGALVGDGVCSGAHLQLLGVADAVVQHIDLGTEGQAGTALEGSAHPTPPHCPTEAAPTSYFCCFSLAIRSNFSDSSWWIQSDSSWAFSLEGGGSDRGQVGAGDLGGWEPGGWDEGRDRVLCCTSSTFSWWG